MPTSDRNASLQFCNNIKAPQSRTFEFTSILLQSISNDISDSINWKDKDSFLSKEQPALGIDIKLTSNSWSPTNFIKIISYKSKYINSNVVEARNYQSKFPILDN